MSRMGKTEENWNGLKLGFLKTVQPNRVLTVFQIWSLLLATSKIMLRRHICLGSLILSFTCNFFTYFKFHSDWGQVIGKIKQNELDCRYTAPLTSCSPKRSHVIMYAHQVSSPSLHVITLRVVRSLPSLRPKEKRSESWLQGEVDSVI